MTAAQILQEARSRSGLSLRELAAKAGTSHATLSAYESGRVVPGFDTLARIVQAAGFVIDTTLTRRRRDGITGPGTRSEELVRALELASVFPRRDRGPLPPTPFRARAS